MPDAVPRPFPPGFAFGVATSAYQVEGHIENDWSEWERAGRLKDPAARCGRGVDHWNRFDEDLGLAKGLGAQVFRLSLEWARIEPEPGRFDERVLRQYRDRLEKMHRAGVTPMVTLHHFTHPRWFHARSPWHEPASVEAFRAYAKACAPILAGLGVQVVTLNEPIVLLLGGYAAGVIPPGIAEGKKTLAAAENMARAHFAARAELKAFAPQVPVGIAQNVLSFAPDRAWHPVDRALVHLATASYNHGFVVALTEGRLALSMPGIGSLGRTLPDRNGLDFLGINYYTRAHLRFAPRRPYFSFLYRDRLERGLTDIGWEDYPEGFGQLLVEMKRYHLPLWVTENGIDDRAGHRRPHYLYAHWRELLRAVDQGVDLRGYLHWSLLDNFEWLEGWGPRFGLYRVDFETLDRSPTPACDYFRRTAQTGLLAPPG